MSNADAKAALQRLQGFNKTFDDDRLLEYVALAKAFLKKSRHYCKTRNLELTTPFIDPTARIVDGPPFELEDSFRVWAADAHHLSPTAKTACEYFVRFAAFKEHLPEHQQNEADLYSPLIALLELGGEFYDHHGSICIGDLAAIAYSK